MASVALLGAVGLATDVGVMYYNYISMQKAVDSAVLAGASYLPEDQTSASSTCVSYANNNGLTASEIQCGSPAANCISFAAGDATQPTQMTQISLTAQRTVPYYFGKVVGMTSQLIKVSATAGLPGNVTCVNCISSGPTNQPSNSSSGTTNPTTNQCANTGQCDLIPIGLDIRNNYSYGNLLTFQFGVGAGNWDFLTFGANGGNQLRQNIANGYTGAVAVGDFFDTSPGKKVGPADQGFADRIAASPAGSTWSGHTEGDPRVVVMPMVDWVANPNGKKPIEILGFATVYLQSDLGGGQFTGYYVNDQIPNSLVSLIADQPIYHGGRPSPQLLK